MILLDESALDRALQAKKTERNNSSHYHQKQSQDGYTAMLDVESLHVALQSKAERKKPQVSNQGYRTKGKIRILPKRRRKDNNKSRKNNQNDDRRRGNLLRPSNSYKSSSSSNSSIGGETHTSLTSASHPTMSTKSFGSSSNGDYDSDVGTTSPDPNLHSLSSFYPTRRQGRNNERETTNQQRRSKSEPRKTTTYADDSMTYIPASPGTPTGAVVTTTYEPNEGPSFFKQHIAPMVVSEPVEFQEDPMNGAFFDILDQQQQEEQQEDGGGGEPTYFKQYVNPGSVIKPVNHIEGPMETFLDNMGGKDAVESITRRFYEQARSEATIIKFFNSYTFDHIVLELVTLGNLQVTDDLGILVEMVPFHFQLIDNGVDMDKLAGLWTNAYEANWLETPADEGDSMCIAGPSRAVFNLRGIGKIVKQHKREVRRKQRAQEINDQKIRKKQIEESEAYKQEIKVQKLRRRQIMRERRRRKRSKSIDSFFCRRR